MMSRSSVVGLTDPKFGPESVGDASAFEPRWFVAQTQVRAELLAMQNLARQGFKAFCPRFRKARRHARRLDEILVPVFPGYVFVSFDPNRDPWRSINGTIGVLRLVGTTSNRPQPMPRHAMEAIRARCEGDLMTGSVVNFKPGQQVRLLTGPFVNQFAEVERLDDRGRVRVLLNILGGVSPVDVSICAIDTA